MANDGNKSNSNSSYFLHHSDHPGTVLVSKPLDGENYSTWCWATTISLNAKSKFGFVDGTLKAPSAKTKPEDYVAWKNAMIWFCHGFLIQWPLILQIVLFFFTLLMKFGKIFKIVSFKATHHSFSRSRERLLALLKIKW